MDYGALLERVARVLECEVQLLETGCKWSGSTSYERFPAVQEVIVTLTKLRVPVARAVSGVSVETTFVR